METFCVVRITILFSQLRKILNKHRLTMKFVIPTSLKAVLLGFSFLRFIMKNIIIKHTCDTYVRYNRQCERKSQRNIQKLRINICVIVIKRPTFSKLLEASRYILRSTAPVQRVFLHEYSYVQLCQNVRCPMQMIINVIMFAPLTLYITWCVIRLSIQGFIVNWIVNQTSRKQNFWQKNWRWPNIHFLCLYQAIIIITLKRKEIPNCYSNKLQEKYFFIYILSSFDLMTRACQLSPKLMIYIYFRKMGWI